MRAGMVAQVQTTLSEMRGALATRTGRDTQLVFLGQVGAAVLGFGVNVILLRNLSVDDYGLFTLFSSAMMLLAGFMHLGWTDTFVRFGARHRGTPSYLPLRALLLRRVLTGGATIMVLAMAAGGWISSHVYHRDDFGPMLCAAAGGGLFSCIFSFVQNDYRARQEFPKFFSTQLGSSAARLLFCALLLEGGLLYLKNVVAAYLAVPAAFSLLAFVRGNRADPSRVPPELEKEMGSYNRWILVSLLTVNIIGNIDSHFIAHFHDNHVLSAFGAASRLTLPIQFIVTALTTTLLPRLSAAQGDHEIRLYLSRLKLFIIPLAAATALGIWLAPPVMIWIAGKNYETIGFLIQLQIAAMLVVLLTNPAGLVLYAWGWSKAFAVLNVAQLAVDLVLDLAWIPRWGAAGAIVATLVVNLMGLLFIYGSVWVGLARRRSAS